MTNTFADALNRHNPLLLPAAHDALTARIIDACGRFSAYQVGGFALDASAEAIPDIGIRGFDAQFPLVQSIMRASSLPVLVDADTGGDTKSITRMVRLYESLGVGAIFIEDQRPPKKCGHMANKRVIARDEMLRKLRAAMAAKSSPDFLIFARTDALDPLGVNEAIARGLWYADVADGIYVEGIRDRREAELIGEALRNRCLATSVLEGGGATPFLPPSDFADMGFSMVLYPTTVLFQMARVTWLALHRLADGLPMNEPSYTLDEFERLLGLSAWRAVETTFGE